VARKNETLEKLTKSYQSKGILILSQPKLKQFNGKDKICTKIISKMSGEGPKFHNKKIILTENELIYFD
jgi:hypothetical protein